MAFNLLAAANTIKAFAVFFATITIAYAGLTLLTSKSVEQREEWKEVLAGVFLGLVLLFLAPLIASQLAGGHYCG